MTTLSLIVSQAPCFFSWQMHHFFCVGDCVTLVTGYQQYHDAIHGPLKPGDKGLMISCDIYNGAIRALVAVSGRSWYYDKCALRGAPANRGPMQSMTCMQGATGLSAGAVPANLYPNHAALTGAPLPPDPAAAVAAPAAASLGTSGFSFGAYPAAGSSSPGAAAAVAAPAAASLGAGGFTFGGALPAAGSPSPGAPAAVAAPVAVGLTGCSMKTSASYLEPQASHTLILIFALLLALVSQKKATADLVRAAEKGDLATVQDCLS